MEILQAISTLVSGNHPRLHRGGFAHLVNVGWLDGFKSFTFAEGLRIRGATPSEVATIRSLLGLESLGMSRLLHRNPYETSVTCTLVTPKRKSCPMTKLPRSEWRYTVVEFPGSNGQAHDLAEASILTDIQLKLGIAVVAGPGMGSPGLVGGPTDVDLQDRLAFSDEGLLGVGRDDLKDIKRVYECLRGDNVGIQQVRQAIKRFEQIERIPETSPFRYLGYMSILESLVTHAPTPQDPYDSLTRQVRQKMLLLDNRMVLPTPYNLLSGEQSHATVWNRVYELRSAIAHGGAVDFGKRLSCLRDQATATAFLSKTTRATMRQLLEEPALLQDLRAC